MTATPASRAAAYDRAARRYRRLHARVERLSALLGGVRLVSFLVAASCTFAGWYDQAWALYGPIAGVAWLVFAVAVALHREPYFLEPRLRALLAICAEGAARLRGEWDAVPDHGGDFLDDHAPWLGELQIFGRCSLYQLISRATLPAGRAGLAVALREGVPLADLEARQQVAQELGRLRGLRHRVQAEGRLVLIDEEALQRFFGWAEAESHIGWLKPAVIAGALLVPATLAQGVLSAAFDVTTAWRLTLGLQVVLYLLTTRRLSADYVPLLGDARHRPFIALRRMFARVEARRFQAPLLKRVQADLGPEGQRPSQRMATFESVLEALAVRHSALLYALVSVGLMWELFQGARLERWRARHGKRLRADVAALADFEVLASLGAFADDHPAYAWPTVAPAGDGPVLEGRALGHPLFPAATRKTNDFTIPSGGLLVLITGSNMSGKSSFLRTVGINTRLAQAGAPACAEALRLVPCGLSTSIQVTDAPAFGLSRFYAEVKRIRGVVEAVEAAEQDPALLPRLYLVDEMLSGTNSRERNLACRAIVRRLVAAERSFGLVTTHDLDLVGIAEDLPENIVCYHFGDRFDGEKLHFDYTLTPGVAKTTNALHVLAMEGIEVPGG